jgi:hypothetical protein
MGRFLNDTDKHPIELGASNSRFVTVTGTDAFAKGDLVFLDYSLGTVVNRNNAAIPDILTAGSSGLIVQHPVQAGSNSSANAAVVLPDGSQAIFTISYNNNDLYTRLTSHLYDAVGNLVVTKNRILGSASSPNDFPIMAVHCPASPNRIWVMTKSAGTTVSAYMMDEKLNLQLTVVVEANSMPHAFAPCTDGGVLTSTANGVYKISTTGTITTHSSTVTSGSLSLWTNGGDCAKQINTGFSQQYYPFLGPIGFFSISTAGWGLFRLGSTAITYLRFNADGTLRGTTTVASGLTTASKLDYAVGASGNIFWMVGSSTGTTWGIISDSGTVVKAATLKASSDPFTSLYPFHTNVIPDVNGDFFFTWSSSSGTVLNMDYVGGTTGTSKGSYPQTTTTIATNFGGNKLFRLSTGIIHFWNTGTPNVSTYSMAFISNAGAAPVLNGQPILPNSDLSAMLTFSATVFNDELYCFQPNAATAPSDPACYLFKVLNTGKVGSINHVAGNVSTYQVMPVLTVDATEIRAHAGASVWRFKTSDLTLLNQYEIGGLWTSSGNCNLKLSKFGDVVYEVNCVIGGAYSTIGSTPWNIYLRANPKRTVLLGVAASSSLAGSPVLVQTRGLAVTNVKGAASFNQLSNVPSGNKGTLSGTVIALEGIVS